MAYFVYDRMEIQYIKNRAWCFDIGKKCNFKNSHDFLKRLNSTLLKNFIKILILEPFWGKCINDSTKNYRFLGEKGFHTNVFFCPFLQILEQHFCVYSKKVFTCCSAKSPDTPNNPNIRRYSSTFLPGKCFCINSTEQT